MAIASETSRNGVHVKSLKESNMAENEKRVEANKFEFRLRLKDEFEEFKEFNVYTRLFKTHELDIIGVYATPERIAKWKKELIEAIEKCDNPFDISIGDTDRYAVPESEIFELPEGYTKSYWEEDAECEKIDRLIYGHDDSQ